jgi:hypothetical protein
MDCQSVQQQSFTQRQTERVLSTYGRGEIQSRRACTYATHRGMIIGVGEHQLVKFVFVVVAAAHTFVNGIDRRIIHFSSRNVNSRGWRKSTHPDRGEPGGSAERVVGKGDEWIVQT